MSMWNKSGNGESQKPPEVSIDPSGVVVRRNYNLVSATEEFPAHWEYEEAQMSKEQYEAWSSQNTVNEQDRADIDYLLMITDEE